MIFIDSNIPMYLIGADHPNKIDARRMIEEAVASEKRLVSDAEVLQEILHRYTAINRKDAIQPAYELMSLIADEIYPVIPVDMFRAKDIVLGYSGLSARDAVHIAVMLRNSIDSIMTFDTAFGEFPGISLVE